MIAIRQITKPHGPDSPVVGELVRVFCDARRDRLRFLMDLHGSDEDRAFLSGVVLPNHQVWVADAGGEVAGFIAFGGGWVHHLYVSPAHQRKGIGKALLDRAKADGPALQLWAFEVNEPAIAFYESQGFRTVGRTAGDGNEARMPDVRMEWVANRSGRTGSPA